VDCISIRCRTELGNGEGDFLRQAPQ